MLLEAIRLIKVFKVVICVTTVAISSFSTAANKTELIISQVLTTYGGEKFRKIKTIQLTDQLKPFAMAKVIVHKKSILNIIMPMYLLMWKKCVKTSVG